MVFSVVILRCCHALLVLLCWHCVLLEWPLSCLVSDIDFASKELGGSRRSAYKTSRIMDRPLSLLCGFTSDVNAEVPIFALVGEFSYGLSCRYNLSLSQDQYTNVYFCIWCNRNLVWYILVG